MALRRLPTPHLVQQIRRVRQLEELGYTTADIAHALGVSKPRVSQIRSSTYQLARYIGPEPGPSPEIANRRAELEHLRRAALRLASALKSDLQELDEELETVEIDRLLGLRPTDPGQKPARHR